MAIQDYFDSLIAYNPDTSELVSGATFQVFAVDDSAFATPLAITDPASGANIATLVSSSIGVLPDFRVAGNPPQVVLKSGAFVTKLTSRLGVFTEAGFDPEKVDEAIAAADAAAAAQAAAEEAKTAVEGVVATTDGLMTAVLNNPSSSFAVKQNATIAEAVTAGVAPKANSADVYSKTAADARYAPSDLATQALIPALKFIQQPSKTVLNSFASGHGVTGTVSSGAWQSLNLNDTTQDAWGMATQAITGLTWGTGGAALGAIDVPMTAFDPTGKVFELLIMVDKPVNLAQVFALVTSDNFANFTSFTVLSGSDKAKFLYPNKPYIARFTAGDKISDSGTGMGTAVTKIRFRVQDDGTGQAVTVRFGGVRVFPKPAGVVSLTFDDGYRSHVTFVKAALATRNWRGTFYPIIDRLGVAGNATASEWLDLYRVHGHEVGSHASTLAAHSTGLPAMTAEQRDAELRACRAWLVQNGINGQSYAYPGGQVDSSSADDVQKYYTSARTTSGSQRDVSPPAAPMYLKSTQVDSTQSLATIQGLVTKAQANGWWLILTFHDLVAASATGTQWLQSDFNTLMTSIASSGMAVKPVGEVMQGL